MNKNNHKMTTGSGPYLIGMHTLVGDDVYDIEGKKLGDIKEIMFDVHGGKIRYAVLSFSDFLGMRDKLFAVPWMALTLDTDNKRFVLKVDKDRMKNAPGFDKSKWPNMANQEWIKEINGYYETNHAL